MRMRCGDEGGGAAPRGGRSRGRAVTSRARTVQAVNRPRPRVPAPPRPRIRDAHLLGRNRVPMTTQFALLALLVLAACGISKKQVTHETSIEIIQPITFTGDAYPLSRRRPCQWCCTPQQEGLVHCKSCKFHYSHYCMASVRIVYLHAYKPACFVHCTGRRHRMEVGISNSVRLEATAHDEF